MTQILQWVIPLIVFILLEQLAIQISSIEFKKVLSQELQNINIVSWKNPHPLKRLFSIQKPLLVLTGIISALLIYYLRSYFKFNPIYAISGLIIYRSFSYLFYKRKKASFKSEDYIKFSQCFREDYEKFTNISAIQAGFEVIGFVIGLILVLFLDFKL